MSVVGIVKHHNKFVVISDSRCSREVSCNTPVNDYELKLVRAFDDNKTIISHVGIARDFSIIKCIPKLCCDFDDEHPEFNFDYVKEVLVPKVKNKFKEFCLIGNDEPYKFPTNLLVCRDNKAFNITPNGEIIEIGDSIFIGSGSLAALGWYRTCYHVDNELVKGLQAIQSGIKYNILCDYPILITSCDTDKVHKLTKEQVETLIKKEMEAK